MGQHHHNHHSHNHGSASERMGWAFFLNLGFTIVEFIGGWLTNSTAIMADAVHDLGDSISIGSAWLLGRLGDKQADQTYTYGYKRLSLFGALIKDRKSTRLNSSHVRISYAVFCLKKKKHKVIICINNH